MTPHLLNDFVVYISGGEVNLHKNFNKQQRRNKYISKVHSMSPNSKQNHSHFLVNYLLEDYDSLSFWNLVDNKIIEKQKEEIININQYEHNKIEK